MTTPVTSTTASAAQTSTSSNIAPAVPVGVGSQPTTISSSTPSSNTDYWQTVKSGLRSFGDFIRNLVVKALDAIRSGVGFIADWIAGKPMETSSSTTDPSLWQLPPEPLAQISNAGTTQDPLAALPLTDPEREKIYRIVHTLGIAQGAAGWLTLLRQRAVLEQLGQEIHHVHPLKFMEYSLKHPALAKDLDSLSQGTFTWNPFVGGFSEKMRRESATLAGCKAGFARSLNINLADIDPFFARSDWEGLLKFLIDVKNGRKSSVWVEPALPESPIPVATTTTATAAGAITAAATTVVHLANLPFERAAEEIISDLMNCYAQNSRLWLIWNHNRLHIQWTNLALRHPLKLLAYIYSKPALIMKMDTIFAYYGTKWMFMNALTGHLSRAPFAEVDPYLDEFAQICHLDPNRTRQLIQNGQWNPLVEELQRSHLAHRS